MFKSGETISAERLLLFLGGDFFLCDGFLCFGFCSHSFCFSGLLFLPAEFLFLRRCGHLGVLKENVNGGYNFFLIRLAGRRRWGGWIFRRETPFAERSGGPKGNVREQLPVEILADSYRHRAKI